MAIELGLSWGPWQRTIDGTEFRVAIVQTKNDFFSSDTQIVYDYKLYTQVKYKEGMENGWTGRELE